MASPTHFEPSPVRLSTNFSINRQTPKMDFGDRLQSGFATATSVIASGAGIVGTVIPAAALISAAMSSVSQLASARGNTAYASTAMYSGGGAVGQMNADLLAQQNANQQALANQRSGVSSTGSNTIASANSDLAASSAENAELLRVQIALQRENQQFTAISNILKTRHDTLKNTIGNIR
jgi:hypothetical protein